MEYFRPNVLKFSKVSIKVDVHWPGSRDNPEESRNGNVRDGFLDTKIRTFYIKEKTSLHVNIKVQKKKNATQWILRSCIRMLHTVHSMLQSGFHGNRQSSSCTQLADQWCDFTFTCNLRLFYKPSRLFGLYPLISQQIKGYTPLLNIVRNLFENVHTVREEEATWSGRLPCAFFQYLHLEFPSHGSNLREGLSWYNALRTYT